LLAGYMRKLSPQAKLALGPVRVVGEDDRYPKNVHGEAVEPTRFTIRAEKAPNRRGVEIVLKHFAQAPLTFGDMLAQAATGQLDALYLVGGDPGGWISAEWGPSENNRRAKFYSITKTGRAQLRVETGNWRRYAAAVFAALDAPALP